MIFCLTGFFLLSKYFYVRKRSNQTRVVHHECPVNRKNPKLIQKATNKHHMILFYLKCIFSCSLKQKFFVAAISLFLRWESKCRKIRNSTDGWKMINVYIGGRQSLGWPFTEFTDSAYFIFCLKLASSFFPLLLLQNSHFAFHHMLPTNFYFYTV